MKRLWMGVMVAGVGGLVGAYQMGRAHASGVPQTSALSYTGQLLSYGAPDNGTHTMTAALYLQGSVSPACTSSPMTVAATNGRFTINLPDTCAEVVHQNANVQIQVTVDGNPLGLAPLTAVPYALEADTATNAAAGSPIALGLVPTGTVIPYWGPVGSGKPPPAGWLYCNGQEVSRATYANLFQVIGVSAGAGDGTTTFNVPDLRGYFLRGLDQGAGRDPDVVSRTAMNAGGNTGDAVGSVQQSQLQAHSHGVNDPGHGHAQVVTANPGSCPGSGTVRSDYTGDASNACSYSQGTSTGASRTGISLQSAGGAETRALNAAVNFLIKL